MSLKVWLPLKDNTRNYGTADIVFKNDKNGGALPDNDGKLGKCYAFDADGSNGETCTPIYSAVNIDCSRLTMCCWVYLDQTRYEELSHCEIVSSLNTSAGGDNAAICMLFNAESDLSKQRIEFIAGTSTSKYDIDFATNIYNRWVHLAITFDSSVATGYVNGIQVLQVKAGVPTERANLVIGARSNSSTLSSFKFGFNGKLSDYRLYDECLSPSEIKDIAKGLICHYKLDNISNGVVPDSSGWGNHGTVTGTVVSDNNSARYTKSVYIADGLSGYITSPTLTLDPKAITTSIWFKSTSTTPAGKYHLVVNSTENYQWVEISVRGNAAFRAGLTVNGTRYAANTTSLCLDGVWHMFTLSYDGTTIKRYCDGEVVSSTNVTATTGLNSSTAIIIGKVGAGASTDYAVSQAYLSDFRLYNTALSDNDVMDMYKASVKLYSSGCAYPYEFVEQGIGTTKDTKVTSTGLIESSCIMDVPFALQYDTKVYQELDGSCWIRIAHHNNPVDNLFTENSTWSTGVYVSEDAWYDVERILPYFTGFEFMAFMRDTAGSSSTHLNKYRWTQYVSPLTATMNDVMEDKITWAGSPYVHDQYMGGLYMPPDTARMCVATAVDTGRRVAMGSWALVEESVKGYRYSTPTSITTGVIDLYIRLQPKMIKNSGFYAPKLIER